jgi:hypothetical protein
LIATHQGRRVIGASTKVWRNGMCAWRGPAWRGAQWLKKIGYEGNGVWGVVEKRHLVSTGARRQSSTVECGVRLWCASTAAAEAAAAEAAAKVAAKAAAKAAAAAFQRWCGYSSRRLSTRSRAPDRREERQVVRVARIGGRVSGASGRFFRNLG